METRRAVVDPPTSRDHEAAPSSARLGAHLPLSKLQRSLRHHSPPPRFIHRQHVSMLRNTAPQLYQCFSTTSSGISSLRRVSGGSNGRVPPHSSLASFVFITFTLFPHRHRPLFSEHVRRVPIRRAGRKPDIPVNFTEIST